MFFPKGKHHIAGDTIPSPHFSSNFFASVETSAGAILFWEGEKRFRFVFSDWNVYFLQAVLELTTIIHKGHPFSNLELLL